MDDSAPNKSATNVAFYVDDAEDEVLLLESTEIEVGLESNPNTTSHRKTTFSSSGSLPSTRPSSATSYHSSSDQSLPYFSSSKNRKRALTKQSSSMTEFADRLSKVEEAEISESLAQFFYGCNIPLSAVDSVYFRNFIKKIRPAYADKVPGRKMLSTRLLDSAYEKCLNSAKASMSSDSVLLIDGWKNSSSNTKTVVSMLHNANGEQAFLEAWDLTGESETAEKLADIVSESVDLAKKMYSTNVYAVVSDNASAMNKMGKITKHFVWKSNCSSHTGNLLCKDILNRDLNHKVTSILKEYKQADLEKKIVEKGGTRIKLPCETRWCSHRDAYKCLIQNAQYMRIVAADSKVKENIVSFLFDSKFIDEVKNAILLLDPICNLINECQSSKCTAAEAVDMWLNLKLPGEFATKLKSRQEMALNKYALVAFYLHPFLDNTKLSSAQNNIIFDFLFKYLDGPGIEEWDSFRNKSGFFEMLYEKDIKKPLVFWSMAEMKFPILTKLSKKLLQIPASSAQIERLFSSWAHVHSIGRNRLTFQRSKKLLHIYYSLRIKDVILDEYDIEEVVD